VEVIHGRNPIGNDTLISTPNYDVSLLESTTAFLRNLRIAMKPSLRTTFQSRARVKLRTTPSI
jgi:hypothetical protein